MAANQYILEHKITSNVYDLLHAPYQSASAFHIKNCLINNKPQFDKKKMDLLSKYNFLLNPQTFILGGIFIVMFFRFRKLLDKEEEKSKNEKTQSIPPPNQTLKLIMSR